MSDESRSLSLTMMSRYSWRFCLARDAARLEHLAEHADEGERGLELVADVGHEFTLEGRDPSLLRRREQDRRDAEHDDRAREHDHDELEQRPVLHARRQLVARARRDLQAPAVERRRETHPHGELAAPQRRAEDDSSAFVDHVHAARRRRFGEERRHRVLHDAPEVVPRDHEVAPRPAALADLGALARRRGRGAHALPVAHEVALAAVLVVQVVELVGRLLRRDPCRRTCAARAACGRPLRRRTRPRRATRTPRPCGPRRARASREPWGSRAARSAASAARSRSAAPGRRSRR